MHRRILATTLVVLLTGLMIGVIAPPASAHEGRKVGNYEFTVGWGTEPAYAGFQNSVQVRLLDARRDPHTPVNDLGDTLKVDVTFGTQTGTYTLEPGFVPGVFGDEGDYRAYLVPTRPGTYKFRFHGTIRRQRVDTTFTSGPKSFDDVHNTTEAQFPVKDPSTADLDTKLTRENQRLQTQLTAATKKANDAADQAKLFAYGGLGLAAIATVISLARGRKKGA